MERIGVGVLGLGTVGGGVARILRDSAERLRVRVGRPVEIMTAAVRDLDRPRDGFPADRLTTDPFRVIRDPEVRVVIETMGGIEPARTLVLEALASGKDVITANKALIAEHGPELFAQARKSGRALAFEASVGGGIPIVQALLVGLAANQVVSLAAILNGTCNFILTSMALEGMAYDTALAQAQKLGYAEADPTMDVDGTDTTHKLAILAQLAFGKTVTLSEIPRRGIDTLELQDIRFAGELGYAVKLLALARLSEAGLALRVGPTLVKHGTPLAEVRGPYNAIRVVGDAVGDTLFYGRGAGAMPTASAVVGDLIDVVSGRAGITSRVVPLWSEMNHTPNLARPEDVRSRYYLRFTIADQPGVLASLAQALGRQDISISSVIQHEPGADLERLGFVPLVMMTHEATEANVQTAFREIHRLKAVVGTSVCYGVLD